MGYTVNVSINITAKAKTPKKILEIICEELRERMIDVKAFELQEDKTWYLEFDNNIHFAGWGLAEVEGLKLPVKVNKYVTAANMTLTYLEQAPIQEFDLLDEEEEEN
jgi:hypothetical protein